MFFRLCLQNKHLSLPVLSSSRIPGFAATRFRLQGRWNWKRHCTNLSFIQVGIAVPISKNGHEMKKSFILQHFLSISCNLSRPNFSSSFCLSAGCYKTLWGSYSSCISFCCSPVYFLKTRRLDGGSNDDSSGLEFVSTEYRIFPLQARQPKILMQLQFKRLISAWMTCGRWFQSDAVNVFYAYSVYDEAEKRFWALLLVTDLELVKDLSASLRVTENIK